jgi:hypothetical protein
MGLLRGTVPIAGWRRSPTSSVATTPAGRPPGGSGWVLIPPFIGSAISRARRAPTRDEVERQRLAEVALHDSAAARPFDSTGTAP